MKKGELYEILPRTRYAEDQIKLLGSKFGFVADTKHHGDDNFSVILKSMDGENRTSWIDLRDASFRKVKA